MESIPVISHLLPSISIVSYKSQKNATAFRLQQTDFTFMQWLKTQRFPKASPVLQLSHSLQQRLQAPFEKQKTGMKTSSYFLIRRKEAMENHFHCKQYQQQHRKTNIKPTVCLLVLQHLENYKIFPAKLKSCCILQSQQLNDFLLQPLIEFFYCWIICMSLYVGDIDLSCLYTY